MRTAREQSEGEIGCETHLLRISQCSDCNSMIGAVVLHHCRTNATTFLLLLLSRQDNVVELVDQQRHARMCVCVYRRRGGRLCLLCLAASEEEREEKRERRKINFELMELDTESEGYSTLPLHGLELTTATRTRIFIAYCSARDFQISRSNEVTDVSSKIDVYCQVIALSLSLAYFNGSERN